MQYSITVRGPDKATAKAKAARQLDELVQMQTLHQHDRGAILATVHAVVDLVPDNPERDVSVCFSGYITSGLTSISVGATASLVVRGYDPDALPATPKRRAGD